MAKLPTRIEKDPTYGLNVYPLAEALLRSSPDFYLNHPMEARACLCALTDDDALAVAVREVGGESYAGRLIGALEAVGRREVAESVRRMLKRERRRIEEILKDMDAGYVSDSYHSLSIEGYRVSEDLIRRVRDGQWDPKVNADDYDQKSALAASGYYRAYRRVRAAIASIVSGADPGMTIANGIIDWHRELFLPCVDAGLLLASDLAGYRRGQVYIAGSRYTPPAASDLPDAMDSFFELVKTESDYRVRAVLGHFFFVHIHPYADGNGRTARFIMNASLLAGGGRWTVIPVDLRERYMKALETASVDGKIGDFLSLLGIV